jgi:hypothetical protein
MDRAISRYLGLLPTLKHPKDEFTSGYFAFFVPAFALAIGLWLLLRLFARSRLTREFLRSGAGIAALIGTPVSWLCLMWASSSRYGWNPLMAIEFYEVLLILVLGVMYLSKNWPFRGIAILIVLVLHYGFWFWEFGPRFSFGAYADPLAPAVGLFAGVAWILYLRQLMPNRRAPQSLET